MDQRCVHLWTAQLSMAQHGTNRSGHTQKAGVWCLSWSMPSQPIHSSALGLSLASSNSRKFSCLQQAPSKWSMRFFEKGC